MDLCGVVLTLLCLHTSGPSTEALDLKRPAAPDALIEIENHAGSTTVMGWEHDEVSITGSLARGAEGVGVEGDEHRIKIAVKHRGRGESDLDVHVPRGSRVEVSGHSSDVKVSGVQGSVRVQVVSGGVTVTGTSQVIEVNTVSGDINVDASSKKTHAESVNGDVTVRGVSGEVEASTVSGDLVVEGKAVEEGHFETVSGELRFRGSLTAKGSLNTQTVSGGIEIVLPASIAADFQASSFSGDIENDFGGVAHSPSKHGSSRDLSFSTGGGGAKVTAHTLSGTIEIRKRASGTED
jgi:DUF4097 and DUF4098 domain-containing protein YvlB